MAEHVVLFAGSMGAGKTTAISSLSEIDVVTTEAENSDRSVADKATTTVALDYGEISLGPDEKIRLYGVPGQKRFDFMWTIMKERAVGMVLLVNNDSRHPIDDMRNFIEDFRELYERGGIVVGVTRSDVSSRPGLHEYTAALAAAYPDLVIPVMSVDARNTAQMRTILMTLIVNMEARHAANASVGDPV